MSQYGDILRNEIGKGISRNTPAEVIVDDLNTLLGILEYTDMNGSVGLSALVRNMGAQAEYMGTQKEGMYHGVTHEQLKTFRFDLLQTPN